ncbi:MAG: type II toxin-antitoxin system PemK/MazF family toxin [Oscillospiraceae bacterium]|nr:type II toxin-antitoxin system PemK/MazF family toxin [Oscillospiraceae bacterium]
MSCSVHSRAVSGTKKALHSERSDQRVKRGDIYYANLSDVVGSEQGGIRPVLVVQNNIANRYSPTLIVVSITTARKRRLPVHIPIFKSGGLQKNSTILAEQIRTIDRSRLLQYIGSLDESLMQSVDHALKISLGVNIDEKIRTS